MGASLLTATTKDLEDLMGHITISNKVGRAARHTLQQEQDAPLLVDPGTLSSPLCDAERSLGYLLGLGLHHWACGAPVQPCEAQLRTWLESPLLRGGGLLRGLQPTDPYDEEKGEARSQGGSSTATPGGLAREQALALVIVELDLGSLHGHFSLLSFSPRYVTMSGDVRVSQDVTALYDVVAPRDVMASRYVAMLHEVTVLCGFTSLILHHGSCDVTKSCDVKVSRDIEVSCDTVSRNVTATC